MFNLYSKFYLSCTYKVTKRVVSIGWKYLLKKIMSYYFKSCLVGALWCLEMFGPQCMSLLVRWWFLSTPFSVNIGTTDALCIFSCDNLKFSFKLFKLVQWNTKHFRLRLQYWLYIIIILILIIFFYFNTGFFTTSYS